MKLLYDSRQAAERAAQELVRQHMEEVFHFDEDDCVLGVMNAYECPKGGHWHVGHTHPRGTEQQ